MAGIAVAFGGFCSRTGLLPLRKKPYAGTLNTGLKHFIAEAIPFRLYEDCPLWICCRTTRRRH